MQTQVLHPHSHTTSAPPDTHAQHGFIPTKEHLCACCSPPHSYLLRSKVIVVETRGNSTEIHFLSFSCLCSSLLRDGERLRGFNLSSIINF